MSFRKIVSNESYNFVFQGSQYSLEIPVENKPLPLNEKLMNGFGPGSALYTEIRINNTCDNFAGEKLCLIKSC